MCILRYVEVTWVELGGGPRSVNYVNNSVITTSGMAATSNTTFCSELQRQSIKTQGSRSSTPKTLLIQRDFDPPSS
jgi:hypothetical protein